MKGLYCMDTSFFDSKTKMLLRSFTKFSTNIQSQRTQLEQHIFAPNKESRRLWWSRGVDHFKLFSLNDLSKSFIENCISHLSMLLQNTHAYTGLQRFYENLHYHSFLIENEDGRKRAIGIDSSSKTRTTNFNCVYLGKLSKCEKWRKINEHKMCWKVGSVRWDLIFYRVDVQVSDKITCLVTDEVDRLSSVLNVLFQVACLMTEWRNIFCI